MNLHGRAIDRQLRYDVRHLEDAGGQVVGVVLGLTRIDPNSKDRYATGTPHDHHGDLLDALRYCLMGIYRDLMNRRQNRTAYSDVNL